VMDAAGKLIMECLLETKASTIVEFIQGLQGTLSLTFEEGTSAPLQPLAVVSCRAITWTYATADIPAGWPQCAHRRASIGISPKH
jgi:hypothetical protein